MQFAKDTFFITLRDRLAALNPARTITLDGQARPAVVALENEPVTVADASAVADPQTIASQQRGRVANAFYLAWGAARIAAQTGAQPIIALECAISFSAAGSSDGVGQDRGRLFTTLAEELLQIARPARATKRDYSGTTPQDLGTEVFWTPPRFAAPQTTAAEMRGSAAVTLFCWPEVSC